MKPRKNSKTGGGMNALVKTLIFELWRQSNDNTLVGVKLPNGGTITVLDRLTGWSSGRDIETGYRAPGGRFWLASGNFDIRRFPDITITEAIEKIKVAGGE